MTQSTSDTQATATGSNAKAASPLTWVAWYVVGLFIAITFSRHFILPAVLQASDSDWTTASLLRLGEVAVLLVLLIIGFIWVQQTLRRLVVALETTGQQKTRGGQAVPARAAASKGGVPEIRFPDPPTLMIGVWVLISALTSMIALLVILGMGTVIPDVLRDPLLTMFAAGVGSSIATTLGYLTHASESKDFDPAYAAWYIGRPIMGLLLGLLFFFVIKSGLLVASQGAPQHLNEFGLIAIGGMVGMFTKNAVEKLREVFSVMFRTDSDAKREAGGNAGGNNGGAGAGGNDGNAGASAGGNDVSAGNDS